ncbi:MAG TPA: hypothetical protein VJZ93_04100 [Candidatus Nanoarchaeia archaeon]|nr:hypothetical protein [Candidatus Nanoarchaeia archaeon]
MNNKKTLEKKTGTIKRKSYSLDESVLKQIELRLKENPDNGWISLSLDSEEEDEKISKEVCRYLGNQGYISRIGYDGVTGAMNVFYEARRGVD